MKACVRQSCPLLYIQTLVVLILLFILLFKYRNVLQRQLGHDKNHIQM